MDHARQGPDLIRREMHGVGEQRREVVDGQRAELKSRRGHGRRLQLRDRVAQGVRRSHLSIAIRTDEEHVIDVGTREQRCEQVQRRRIGPLQIVQEYHQRVPAARQRADETHEDHLETVQRGHAVERRSSRLRPHEPFDLWDDRGQDCCPGAQCVGEQGPPRGQTIFGLGQQLSQHTAERVDQASKRDMSRHLVELAAREIATRLHQRAIQLLHQRGLADAGRPADEDRTRRSSGCAVERAGQRLQLGRTAIQLPRHHEPAADVVKARREAPKGRRVIQRLAAHAKIGDDARGALIPVVRRLGEQLRQNGRECLLDAKVQTRWWGRRTGHVPVHELEWVVRGKGQRTGQDLVEQHADGVEVGAMVDCPIHSSGLLRRHVRENRPHACRERDGRRRHRGGARAAEVDE